MQIFHIYGMLCRSESLVAEWLVDLAREIGPLLCGPGGRLFKHTGPTSPLFLMFTIVCFVGTNQCSSNYQLHRRSTNPIMFCLPSWLGCAVSPLPYLLKGLLPSGWVNGFAVAGSSHWAADWAIRSVSCIATCGRSAST